MTDPPRTCRRLPEPPAGCPPGSRGDFSRRRGAGCPRFPKTLFPRPPARPPGSLCPSRARSLRLLPPVRAAAAAALAPKRDGEGGNGVGEGKGGEFGGAGGRAAPAPPPRRRQQRCDRASLENGAERAEGSSFKFVSASPAAPGHAGNGGGRAGAEAAAPHGHGARCQCRPSPRRSRPRARALHALPAPRARSRPNRR